jgi:CHAD domain-containing protein
MSHATPLELLHGQVGALLGHLPSVLDGDVDGVHDARVVTRRIRELFPLTHEWHHQTLDDFIARFKRLSRSLGRVRDADVQHALLNCTEFRIPSAAPSLAVLRQKLQGKRVDRMRKLIKRLERLEMEHLLRTVSRRSAHQGLWSTVTDRWRRQVRERLWQRASAVSESIVHATGTYFPNRSHTARIALKKFRYAAEIAAATGVESVATDGLKEFKKSQALLGELHDRQTLVDELSKHLKSKHADMDGQHLRLVMDFAQAETLDLYRRFVDRRDRLFTIVERTREALEGRRTAVRGSTVVVGAVAFSSGCYLWRQVRPRAHTSDHRILESTPARTQLHHLSPVAR